LGLKRIVLKEHKTHEKDSSQRKTDLMAFKLNFLLTLQHSGRGGKGLHGKVEMVGIAVNKAGS
jgi:hypothetical protein